MQAVPAKQASSNDFGNNCTNTTDKGGIKANFAHEGSTQFLQKAGDSPRWTIGQNDRLTLQNKLGTLGTEFSGKLHTPVKCEIGGVRRGQGQSGKVASGPK